MPDFAVILPAAGRSTRFGGSISKLLQPLGGRPVLAWTLARLRPARRCAPDRRGHCRIRCDPRLLRNSSKNRHWPSCKICPGGFCRADSVRLAAMACDAAIDWVAVHDAARPLVSQALIDRTFQAALAHGAAGGGIARSFDDQASRRPVARAGRANRSRATNLWAMQTPQAMRRQDLLDAFADCPIPLEQITDDVQLLELAGKTRLARRGRGAKSEDHHARSISRSPSRLFAASRLKSAGPTSIKPDRPNSHKPRRPDRPSRFPTLPADFPIAGPAGGLVMSNTRNARNAAASLMPAVPSGPRRQQQNRQANARRLVEHELGSDPCRRIRGSPTAPARYSISRTGSSLRWRPPFAPAESPTPAAARAAGMSAGSRTCRRPADIRRRPS